MVTRSTPRRDIKTNSTLLNEDSRPRQSTLQLSLAYTLQKLGAIPTTSGSLVFCDDERIRVTNRSVRIVPRLGFSALGTGRKISGGIGRSPDTFVLLEIPTVSGSRDSIRATSMTAMSGQLDFRSAWQNSDATSSKASYYEGTETERIMYIIYIDSRVISFYLSVSC